MKTDEELIWEAYDNRDFYWFYHGGAKWTKYDAKIKAPKRGKYEAGAGIYLTNNYETARKYAKGSKIVSKVGISKNITFADKVNIPVKDIVKFAKLYIGPKYRKLLLDGIEYSGKDPYPAQYLINLSVNYEVGGKNALAIKDFVVEYGVDASYQKQSGDEIWAIVHNTRIIQEVVHTKPSDVPVDEYMIDNNLSI